MQTERKKLHRHDESERGLLPRPENPIGVDEAVEMFVEKVSRIEYVDEIRCLKRGHLHEVWTIFTAPRGQYGLELPIIRIENELLERLTNRCWTSEPLTQTR